MTSGKKECGRKTFREVTKRNVIGKKECYRQAFRKVTMCKRLFRQVIDSCFIIEKFIGKQSYYVKNSLVM